MKDSTSLLVACVACLLVASCAARGPQASARAPAATAAPTAFVQDSSNGHEPRLWPTIFVIGCGRCGSTSLYTMLSEHHDMLQTQLVGNDTEWVRKELEFWGGATFKHGLSYYFDHFPVPRDRLADALSGQLRAMDSSPSYSSLSVVPSRIKAAYPANVVAQMRMLLILRNPADRFMSYFCRALSGSPSWALFADAVRKLGLPAATSSMGEVVRRASEHVSACLQKTSSREERAWCAWQGSPFFDVLHNGLYLQQLRHWLASFPPSQFFVTTTMDLEAHARPVMQSAFDFAGMATGDPKHTLSWENGTHGATHANGDADKCGRASLPAAAVAQLDDFYAPHNAALAKWLHVHQGSLGSVRDEAIVDIESWSQRVS